MKRQLFTVCGILAFVGISILSVEAIHADQPGGPTGITLDGRENGFVPRAGYKRTLDLLRLRRRVPAFLEAAPSQQLSVSGTRSIPVICVDFANVTHQFDTTAYQALLFEPAGAPPATPQPTLTQYYRDISNGRFTARGEVFGWYQLPEKDTYYEGNNNGSNEAFGELLKSAFESADADTDFGQFDNDGPDGIPNSGDDDGIVDTVFLVHPEKGGECGNGSKNIWSHSFQYSQYAVSNGNMFSTADVRRNEQGNPVLNPDGTEQTIKIEDYTVQPGEDCSSTATSRRIIPIGVFCHEYGHALGLPDLYDRTDSDSAGIGHYCLMAAGSYGFGGGRAATPVHMSAWCKAILGWGNVIEVTSNQTISLEPVQRRNRIYSVDVPNTNGLEYFLIEFRNKDWTPTPGRLNWDRHFNPGGVAIWHVDERVGDSSSNWPFAPRGAGQNDDPSLPSTTPPGFSSPHSLVSLLQRDRQLHLELNSNQSDTNDLFQTGHEIVDDPDCRCGTRGYDGAATGIKITDIDLSAMTAKVELSASPNPPSAAPSATAQTASATQESAVQETSNATWIRSLAPKLRESGSLSTAEIQKLAHIEVKEIVASGAGTDVPKLLQLAVDGRTVALENKSTESEEVLQPVRNWLNANQGASGVKIQLSPDQKHFQRLVGMHVTMTENSPYADANSRAGQLSKLFGENVALQLAPSEEGEPIRFEQLVKVGEKQIPLHCNGIKLYYGNGTLNAMDANILSPNSIQVGGKVLENADSVLQVASDKLGVPLSRIEKQVRQCVHFNDGDPGKGRLATQVKIKTGENRVPIEVLIDNESQEILTVE